MAEISPQIQKLLQQYQIWSENTLAKDGVSTVHVDEVASRVAAFYEKIRGVIDWREEHLLRRAAIERILKRRLFLRIGSKVDAGPVVLELIRSGHFPNDKIEETKIGQVQKALDKYIHVIENKPSSKGKTRMEIQGWLSDIAACEIEEILDPQRKERALIEFMAELMQERIKIQNNITEEEKNDQIYIAVHRALFKLDTPIISYHLIKRIFPDWSNLRDEELKFVTENIDLIWARIEKQLTFPLSEKFYRICEKMDTPYLILGDVFSEKPETNQEKLNNPADLEIAIRKAYKSRFNKLKSRLFRAAFYSTISIFLTKMLVAFAIEFPFDKYVTQEFNAQALGFSIAIPPFLMLFLVVASRLPGKSNLDKVVVETMKIVYVNEKKDAYPIRILKKGGIMKGIIFLFYLATFVASFWFIWWGLEKLEFSWLSKMIFIFFLSLISYAGTKTRERAKELSLEEEKGGFLSFLFDWFLLPFVRFGKWLSSQWTKYNLVQVLVVILVDLPFQIFIEFLEQWRYFLKEKKEEIH